MDDVESVDGSTEVLAEVRRDGRKVVAKVSRFGSEFIKKYTTATLVKFSVSSVAAAGLAVVFLPLLIGAFAAVAIAAGVVHAVYATRLLKRQDAELRYAWVENKRLEQQVLERDIAVDNATLELLGERPGLERMQRVAPELRSAVAHARRRVVLAEDRATAAEAVREGNATDAQHRAAKRRDIAPSSSPPSSDVVRKRRDQRIAERNRLDAEIQALATADDIKRAMNAEEVKGARRTEKQRRDAAMEASTLARDRARAGRKATTADPDHVLHVGQKPNGDRIVTSGRGTKTPEQIARGDKDADES